MNRITRKGTAAAALRAVKCTDRVFANTPWGQFPISKTVVLNWLKLSRAKQYTYVWQEDETGALFLREMVAAEQGDGGSVAPRKPDAA